MVGVCQFADGSAMKQIALLLVLSLPCCLLATDECLVFIPPKQQHDCVFRERVAIGGVTIESQQLFLTLTSKGFDGIERERINGAFQFHKANRRVVDYPDTLTVVVESLVSSQATSLGWPLALPASLIRLPSDLLPMKVTLNWVDKTGRITESKASELREVVEPWPELRAPQVWYVADFTGIRQPLENDVEIVLTGPGATPEAKLRARLAHPTVVTEISARALESITVHKIMPDAPCTTQKSHDKGTVTVMVVLNPDGKLASALPISGDAVLAECATKAVRQWEFQPYLFKGEAARVVSRVVMKFTRDRVELVHGKH